jgi:hypothetical protein
MIASEEQLRRNAELKLWIENRIGELQEEIDRLREALSVIDSVLRASSFRPAAELTPSAVEQQGRAGSAAAAPSSSSLSMSATQQKQKQQQTQQPRYSGLQQRPSELLEERQRAVEEGEEEEEEEETAVAEDELAFEGVEGGIPEIRELRRDRSGETIAVAEVTRQRLKIEPVAEITLKTETPPFKSFLLGKILSGMKSTDEDSVRKGTLKGGDELRYTLNEKDGKIASLVVENYRQKERLTEILNTSSWTFSRMLEK